MFFANCSFAGEVSLTLNVRPYGITHSVANVTPRTVVLLPFRRTQWPTIYFIAKANGEVFSNWDHAAVTTTTTYSEGVQISKPDNPTIEANSHIDWDFLPASTVRSIVSNTQERQYIIGVLQYAYDKTHIHFTLSNAVCVFVADDNKITLVSDTKSDAIPRSIMTSITRKLVEIAKQEGVSGKVVLQP